MTYQVVVNTSTSFCRLLIETTDPDLNLHRFEQLREVAPALTEAIGTDLDWDPAPAHRLTVVRTAALPFGYQHVQEVSDEQLDEFVSLFVRFKSAFDGPLAGIVEADSA